jgi:hypothetical protein
MVVYEALKAQKWYKCIILSKKYNRLTLCIYLNITQYISVTQTCLHNGEALYLTAG